ncbi:MAG: ABC transporter ATP-binding protein/permease, partial [Caulobacterales bacterium]|nr:ABC transporter ATP-binding protein/permease [Caulobacterales bacterium]
MFAWLVGFTLLATALDIMIPAFAGRLIDAVAAGRENAPEAWRAFAAFAALIAAVFAVRMVGVSVVPPMYTRAMEEMTGDAYDRVQRFSVQWHADTFAGKTVREVSRAMWAFDLLSDSVIFGIGPTLIVLVGLTGYMLATWPAVGLYAVVMLGLFLALSLYLNLVWTNAIDRVSNERDSAIGAALADVLGAVVAVKSFGAEDRETARLRRTLKRWRWITSRAWRRFINAWMLQNAVLIVLQAGLAGLLVAQWAAGRAAPGDVAFAIAAFLLMSGYLRNFGDNVQNLRRGLDEMEDVALYMSMGEQIADAPGAPDFRAGPGEIAFEQVRFGYAGGAGALYDDFSLRIAPGEQVALVGPTGAGKSTFVKLVQRFYDVDAGAVRIDGQDVREVRQASLRRAI